MELFEVLQDTWAIRALIASSLVGLMCGALGAFIVLRNMSLIGDALAHAILPGVVIAFVIVGYSAIGFFTGAVIAGLVTAVSITWIQHKVKTKNDAAIGIVFTAMFSIGVIGISWISRNEGVHLDLKDFLFGNVLGVSDSDLLLTASITLFVLISIIVSFRYLFISTFQPIIAETMGISVKVIHYFLMLMLSFAVVASLQTVGVILVVAMLITPASTALLLSDKLKRVIFISAFLGLISAVLGLIFAIVFATTPGPAMAVTTTMIYLLAAFFAPRKGIIARYLARKKQQRKIEIEDTLKQAFKLVQQSKLTFNRLQDIMGYSKRKLERYMSQLKRDAVFREKEGELVLTLEGKTRANKLLRAHRLWETFLANEIGLNAEQIHDDAENVEHMITEEILDEVDERLGFPKIDPHGSPIPQKTRLESMTISQMKTGQTAFILPVQTNEEVTHELWKLGLSPGTRIVILKSSVNNWTIQTDGKEFDITPDLATSVQIELS